MEDYIEILDKKTTVNGNEVVITKTVKEKLTYEQLLWKKEDCQRRKQRLVQEFQRIKQQNDALNAEEKEIDEMIAMLNVDNTLEGLE